MDLISFLNPVVLVLEVLEYIIIREKIIETLKEVPHDLIGDLGCGNGGFALQILEEVTNSRLICVDKDGAQMLIALARLAGEDYWHRVEGIVSDIIHLEHFRQFDAIVCLNVLHDNSYQLSILKKIREMLKEGGILLLGDQFRKPREIVENFALTPLELKILLKRAGFKDCEILYAGNNLRLYLVR